MAKGLIEMAQDWFKTKQSKNQSQLEKTREALGQKPPKRIIPEGTANPTAPIKKIRELAEGPKDPIKERKK